MFVKYVYQLFSCKKYGTVGAAYSSILYLYVNGGKLFLMVQKYFIKKERIIWQLKNFVYSVLNWITFKKV